MGTKVLQMATVNIRPDEVVDILAELLDGRNLAPDTMYEKYVVDIKKEGDILLVEVDDGARYRIIVNKA